MRVALISDLHGNYVALRAFFAALDAHRVDQIICLGDVATLGPAPHEVIETLAESGCLCLRGNHDDFMLDATLVEQYTTATPVVAAVSECRQTLTRDELAFIESFRDAADIDLGGASLKVFHGSPRSNTEDLLCDTPADHLEMALGTVRSTVMAGGHTHVQMLRQHRGTWLVNPGSLGAPFYEYVHGGTPRILPYAEYALVDSVRGNVSVTLHRLALDQLALLKAAEGWDSPLRDFLIQTYSSN